MDKWGVTNNYGIRGDIPYVPRIRGYMGAHMKGPIMGKG